MLTKGKLNITMDGQFGSTGKGLLNDWIAQNADVLPNICITNASPNAGHTFVDTNGQKRTCFHLPVSGVILPHTQIHLCAGSIIDPVVLAEEMQTFNVAPDRVTIHPRACIVLPEHGPVKKRKIPARRNLPPLAKVLARRWPIKSRVFQARAQRRSFLKMTQQSHATRLISHARWMTAKRF